MMLWLTGLLLLLTLGYAVLQLSFAVQWMRIPTFAARPSESLQQSWTLLIPLRNEAIRLPALLESLDAALAPFVDLPAAVELLFIDDHSTDASLEWLHSAQAERPWISILSLPEGQHGKKAALMYGLSQSTGTWIATLDADVRVPKAWLGLLDAASAAPTKPLAVAGPVLLDDREAFWGEWQALDFCGMMLITAASLRMGYWAMGNGANLAFQRQAFVAVDGYEVETGQESQSGDDMLLLGKLTRRFPGRVSFLKSAEAAVWTDAQPSASSLIQQRWRWSAKTGLHQQWSLSAVLGWVWLFHMALLLAPIALIPGWISPWMLLWMWLGKALPDYFLLRKACRFFDRDHLLGLNYPLQSLRHALYVAGIGSLALLPFSFEWKGRKARY